MRAGSSRMGEDYRLKAPDTAEAASAVGTASLLSPPCVSASSRTHPKAASSTRWNYSTSCSIPKFG